MIKIEQLTNSYVESVRNIKLAAEQITFSGTPEEFLLDTSETTDLHVIKYDEAVVGFFKLDLNYSSNHSFCHENSIGLRAFALDMRQQGKGIGTQAVKALGSYLQANYSGYHSIYLTVNCKNPKAISCYQKGGFEDTKETYHGGAAGPQRIMRRKIAQEG
ncbi:GNAT family N-acetyltransferase [Vibrio marisflavi]|uniref:N-acetyltransferase domain-containing protein n=1 Tax=Vibrio marisflavi CECT 7928 TaxID=634439 RepID=A0ABN8E1U1_9VIBR|nr:GNAT family N-acetyltransferase [Vibrio marisflavi]CAH0537685.1 hypothetical protein VMF7928_01237 [Vibrio marisflavi CECT 7928]